MQLALNKRDQINKYQISHKTVQKPNIRKIGGIKNIYSQSKNKFKKINTHYYQC